MVTRSVMRRAVPSAYSLPECVDFFNDFEYEYTIDIIILCYVYSNISTKSS